MSKIINSSCRHLLSYCKNVNLHQKISKRTFLSNAYYCQEVWNSRLKSPILQKVDIDDFYHELESTYNKNKNISAVDVDIFANVINSDNHVDELLDLVHKLRLSADTCNSLPSTEHAVIRCLAQFGLYDKLLHVLDDRLNYGIFLDSYTANLLLDTFWKAGDYTSGAKVASQIMLQEDFSHPVTIYLSLLHSFKFLQNPSGWTEPPPPVEPEEEVKVRVKFIRNPFFDDHFDIKNPLQLIGKTLSMASASLKDTVGKTFQVIGYALQNKNDKAKQLIKELNIESIASEGLKLLPDDKEIKAELQKLKTENINIQEYLESKVKEAERNCTEKDITDQCKLYDDWHKLRQDALEKQQKRLKIFDRLASLDDKRAELSKKEKLLWYFDNQEKIELEIDDKKVFYPKRWFGKKKKPRQVDESYVPPDVQKAYSKDN